MLSPEIQLSINRDCVEKVLHDTALFEPKMAFFNDASMRRQAWMS